MSRLENLIPPLELCKQIPAGEFEDSALVLEKSEKYFQALDVMDYEYKMVTRTESKCGFSAPTLDEILIDRGSRNLGHDDDYQNNKRETKSHNQRAETLVQGERG